MPLQCDMLAHRGDAIKVLDMDTPILGLDYSERSGGVVMNGSICDNYFCYRADRYPYCLTPQLVFCDYDHKTMTAFNARHLPLETNTWGWLIEWLKKVSYPEHHQEDPRLFRYHSQYGLYFCDGFKMYRCLLNITNDAVRPVDVSVISNQWLPTVDGRLKNYTPITDQMEYIYSINPLKTSDLSSKAYDLSFWTLKYGIPRGGTPAIPVLEQDKTFISFFHSSLVYKGVNRYFMGCFTFYFDANNKSLKLLQLSRHPLIAPVAINKPSKDGSKETNPCGTTLVVFPAGVNRVTGGYHVSYGHNDKCTRVAMFSQAQIDYNLVKVTHKKSAYPEVSYV